MSLLQRARAALAVLPLIALLTSCGGSEASTAPVAAPFVVSLSVAPPGVTIVDSPSGPSLTCEAYFVVSAKGEGTANWNGATFRIFAGADRSAPVDSIVLGPAELSGTLGRVPLREDTSPQTYLWRFTGQTTFEMEAELRFIQIATKVSGSTKARFTCGAAPVQGGPPPAVTSLVVGPATGTVEPGDTLTVTYGATSTSGLWSTIVEVSGGVSARVVTAERLAMSTARTLRIPVPRGSPFGIPIAVTVYATDAATREGHRSVASPTTVADLTPPTITTAFSSIYSTIFPPHASYLYYRLGGQFSVGDTMSVEVEAEDNDAVVQLLYEISPAGTRDSVRPSSGPAAPGIAAWTVKLPVKAEWIGSQTLTLRARDRAGRLSNPIVSPSDSLRFYAPSPHAVSSVVNVPNALSALGDVRFDPKRHLLYIGQPWAKAIAVLNTATMVFEPSITFASTPSGMDLSLSGDSLLVALQGARALGVIALDRRDAPPSVIAMPMLDTARRTVGEPLEPSGVRALANGKVLVGLSAYTSSQDVLAEIDLGSGAQRVRRDVQNAFVFGPWWPTIFERTDDRSRGTLFLADGCARTYRAATDDFTPCTTVKEDINHGISYSSSGSLVAYGRTIRNAELAPQRAVPVLPGFFEHIALSPDGAYAYLLSSTAVSIMRMTDGTLVDRVRTPFMAARIVVSPANDWLLVLADPNMSLLDNPNTRVMKITLQ